MKYKNDLIYSKIDVYNDLPSKFQALKGTIPFNKMNVKPSDPKIDQFTSAVN